jgi:hypothetical protein
MKKGLLIVSALLGFVFFGCTTVNTNSAKVFDPSIPQDQLCDLSIPNYIKVIRFDDKEVSWIGGLFSAYVISVPSGSHKLIVDYRDPTNKVDYPGLTMNCDFDAGSVYYLRGVSGKLQLDKIK